MKEKEWVLSRWWKVGAESLNRESWILSPAGVREDLVNSAQWAQQAVGAHLRSMGQAREGAFAKCMEEAGGGPSLMGTLHSRRGH